MSFPAEIFEKQKQNCLQKCFYMMNLIRNKCPEIWEMYAPVFETLKVEESWEFYHLLIDEYKKIIEGETPVKKKAVAKRSTKKK